MCPARRTMLLTLNLLAIVVAVNNVNGVGAFGALKACRFNACQPHRSLLIARAPPRREAASKRPIDTKTDFRLPKEVAGKAVSHFNREHSETT